MKRNKRALQEALKLNLVKNSYYHELLGYLHSDSDIVKATAHFEQAITLTKSKTEKQTLKKEIHRLKGLCDVKN